VPCFKNDVSDLSLTNCQGINALHACVATANQECFELLLPRASDVDARTVPRASARTSPEPTAAGRFP